MSGQQKSTWGVSVNRDRSEGRGPMYIYKICETEATAYRLAKKACVQGSDGNVIKLNAYKIGGIWYHQGAIVERSTKEDDVRQAILDEEKKRDKKKKEILSKAKELGLSDSEIEFLISK